MIECQYQWQMLVSNQGLDTWFCSKHMKNVNENICLSCPDRTGVRPVPVKESPFPVKSDAEINILQNVCEGCPLFNVASQTCPSADIQLRHYPTNQWGAHPNNHCPEDKW